jgi:hypothetical protein
MKENAWKPEAHLTGDKPILSPLLRSKIALKHAQNMRKMLENRIFPCENRSEKGEGVSLAKPYFQARELIPAEYCPLTATI